jgi:transposase-like protein
VPEDVWPEFKVRAQAAYQAPSRAIARELAAGVVADYGRKFDSAVACFMDDFEACIAHLRFPVTHRQAIRTTNLLERLFVEERRRLKIIPNAFRERAVLKLMFGALIRAAERRRSIKVTEFEHRSAGGRPTPSLPTPGNAGSSHGTRGCSQDQLKSTGGAGLIYCFVAN